MGPHKPWIDRPHSELTRARVRAVMTIDQLAMAAGLSMSSVSRMETSTAGSPEAWLAVARALRVDVATIRPAVDPRQLPLFAEARP